METLNDEKRKILKDWYRKRRLTTLAGIFQKCIFAFEYSAVAVSALFYFTYTFKSRDAKMFYSVTMAMMYFSSTISAMFIGRYMDRTRNLRRIAMSTVLLSIAGNIIYMLPFSKWLPIIARALCGLADGIQPAMSGEFSRCYTEKELGKILSIYHILGAVSYAIAPCTPVLFRSVNFRIGQLTINQYNFIGLFLSVVIGFYGCFVYFFMTDLSKEPGYQVFLQTLDSKPYRTKTTVKCDNIQQMWTLKDVRKEVVILTIICSDSILGYLYSQLEVIMNMIALYDFSWGINRLSLLTFIGVSIFSGLMFVFQQRFLSGAINFYFLFTSCFILAAMELSLMLFAINSAVEIFPVQVLLFESFLGLNIVFGFGSTVYAKWIIFSLVPSHSRSFVESQRYIAAKFGCCCGFFTAAFVYAGNTVCFTIFCFVCLGFVTFLLSKRNSYFEKVECIRHR